MAIFTDHLTLQIFSYGCDEKLKYNMSSDLFCTKTSLINDTIRTYKLDIICMVIR